MNTALDDISYDDATKTFKNHKNEVIAHFDSRWIPEEDLIRKTYCKEISSLIRDVLVHNESEDPTELLIIIKKEIAKVKKDKKDVLLKDAAIVLDLEEESLFNIKKEIANILLKYKVSFDEIKKLHVSTAYLVGFNKYSIVNDLIKKISHFSFDFKVTGVEFLEGATTDKDYLVLKLDAPDSFYKALHEIEKEANVLKFPGGFKTHISLFSIPKKYISKELKEKIIEIIKNNSFTLNHEISVKPESVCVFNNSKLLELRKKIRDKL